MGLCCIAQINYQSLELMLHRIKTTSQTHRKTVSMNAFPEWFIGSCDAPWSKWFWINDPFKDFPIETRPYALSIYSPQANSDKFCSRKPIWFELKVDEHCRVNFVYNTRMNLTGLTELLNQIQEIVQTACVKRL